MHYIRTSFAVMAQQGNKQAAPRMGAQSDLGRAGAVRHLSDQAVRLQRLRLHLLQPRQPRALEPAVEGHRPRGADRRPALRHQRGAQQERRLHQRDHHRVDPRAHQGRGDADHRRRRGARPARCTTRSNCRTTRASRSAASCRSMQHPDGDWVVRDLAGALRRQAARAEAVAKARPAHRRGVRELARPERRRHRGAERAKVIGNVDTKRAAPSGAASFQAIRRKPVHGATDGCR